MAYSINELVLDECASFGFTIDQTKQFLQFSL